MKIVELVKNIKNAKIIGDENAVVLGLATNDYEVKQGSVFFCIKGTKVIKCIIILVRCYYD